jgi:hypothetical protein
MVAAFALIFVGFLLMKRRELRETVQRWYDGPYAALLDPPHGDD